MAQKKSESKRPASKNTKTQGATGTRRAVRGNVTGTSTRSKVTRQHTAAESIANQILPFVFIVSALLVLLVLLLPSEAIVVVFLRNLMLGLLSASAFAIPVFLFLLGVYWRSEIITRRASWKVWCAGISLFLFSALMHIFLSGKIVYAMNELYSSGGEYKSGGVVGGLLGSLFLQCFGSVISLIIILSVLFVLCLLIFGLTPKSVYDAASRRVKENREIRRELAEERMALQASQPAPVHIDTPAPAGAQASENEPAMTRRGRKFNPDVDISADKKSDAKKEEKPTESSRDQDELDRKIFDEVMRRTRERYGEQSFDRDADDDIDADDIAETRRSVKTENGREKNKLTPAVTEDDDDGRIDLSKIFVDPDSIGLLQSSDETDAEIPDDTDEMYAERETVSTPEPAPTSEKPEIPEPEYVFPPISLLTPSKAATAANLDELKENAQRLVDTLRSFNVKTKISDVFHGPTITRYELTPESGTRVRAIANLADDISLGLAAPGVRIEAPIPGKAAVGVEVPNKVRENVMLRGLLENEEFTSAESRLMTALGSDVAGAPVYCDISKMPHLLVAGATGMGKSVCINSIVVSMLYKARPDEVRLIMIDPKKVEFGVYNGIPHLHVPVVNDPKKAAGTLAWAVTEMDRRYEVIESVGVRNIQGYNAITATDPEKPFMPQMVIIIDELADLMMTAPDDVETSICRIAQMGRAAGMHLIIGTQRPSVDVITGLIKANVPSRIACKTSSQVDSRTIIDGAGAEKLLGRGDMLYAPVGVMKPQRVQGAFVSDAEVEKITDFLKGICPTPHYDESAIDGIEEAARQCGQKKGRGAVSEDGDDGASMNDDPMLRQALELAVDSGKISTSLIQRRLSLGYGRAAKLIDRMEALGYVSAPDGQRPREVLITRQQFQELILKNDLD